MPPRTFPPRTLPRLLTAALTAALLAVGGIAIAAPARAHDALLASDPAADSVVEALPAALTLTFSDAIDPTEGASEVQVTDAAGTSLVAGAPTAQDNVLTQPLEGTASGVVSVLWKVVSSDGHPTSGEFAFTVAAPTPTETPTPEPSETEEPTVTASPTESEVPDAPMEPADMTPWLVGGLVLLALVGSAVAYLLVSRARRRRRLAAARSGSEPPADR